MKWISFQTFVLGIVIFIFAVMGMQLFGADYYKNVCEKWACDMPRWNFTDFFHRSVLIWIINSLYDFLQWIMNNCMKSDRNSVKNPAQEIISLWNEFRLREKKSFHILISALWSSFVFFVESGSNQCGTACLSPVQVSISYLFAQFYAKAY